MINGPPEIVSLAVDPDEDLVQVPAPLDMLVSRLPLLVAKFSSKHRSEVIPPEPDGHMADVDPTLMQQIFDLPQ
ncbi:MAG: hypothetical protein DHS20C03_35530 [Minwuia thermotolerans]|nr:MAG: hypothetical protein DHS20C03_35530 [Minwuia thermotolerans]